MERRSLGNTGERVAAIGLGCAGMSEGYGAADDDDSLQTLSVALEQGVDFLDTSDAYGVGHNEELLGRFLQGRLERIVVATKFGLVRKPGAPPTLNNSPEYIRNACNASLQRLRRDAIDLYYVHRRDPAVPIEETVGAMADLVRAGKVRYLGLSEVAPDTLRRAHTVHPIAAVQSEYSLWTRGPESAMLDACRELGVTFVASCPLGRAFLTGALTSLANLEANDFRRRLPRFQDEAFAKNMALTHALNPIAARHGATRAQVALAWCLCKHPHVIPVPGTKHSRYVIENAAAVNVKLTAEDISALDTTFAPPAVAGERYPQPAMAGIESP